ncbi:hypothetical protein Tco_1397609 [Tanacetum coccineum]
MYMDCETSWLGSVRIVTDGSGVFGGEKRYERVAVMTLNEFEPCYTIIFGFADTDDDRLSAFMLFRITVSRHPYLGGAATSGMCLQPWPVFRNVSIFADEPR